MEIGFALQEPVPSRLLYNMAGGYSAFRRVKQRPIVHPFYREIMIKIIKERVKTLKKGGGGVVESAEKPSLFVVLKNEKSLHIAQYFGAVCCTLFSAPQGQLLLRQTTAPRHNKMAERNVKKQK